MVRQVSRLFLQVESRFGVPPHCCVKRLMQLCENHILANVLYILFAGNTIIHNINTILLYLKIRLFLKSKNIDFTIRLLHLL